MGKLLLSIVFVLIIVPVTSARGWRGIVPLHSTRADVERMLGKATGECNCHYETENESISIDYAKRPCEGWPRGWNVPADTVLGLRVHAKKDLLFKDLRLDESKFSLAGDDTFTTYHADRVEGIQYSVSHEGVVNSISYFPSTHDVHLRCKCFPVEDGSAFRGITWDSFEGIPLEDTFARLDNYAIQLMNSPADWIGHVITYSPLRAGRAGAAAYRKRIRDWLVVKRQIDSRRLTVVDGGHREKFAGELYLLSRRHTTPPPLPTIGSCDPKRVK